MSLFLIKIQKVKKKSQAAKGKKKTFRFTRVLALVYIKNIQLLINVTIIAENKLTKLIADKHLYFSRVQWTCKAGWQN